MPAKSKAQQRFMGMVHQCKKTGDCASEEVEKVAKSIKAKDAKKFAKTKHDKLPNRVDEQMSFMDYLLNESKEES